MPQFIIECPNPDCGRYISVRTGLFARREVTCTCGQTIDIRAEKLAGRVCPHCGNNVVFDQSKGEKAKCPVCGEAINTMAEQNKTVEFACGQCGIRLRASRAAATLSCPVCGHENDIAAAAAQSDARRDGAISVIRYEGDNETLIWKHPTQDFNLGSQLIVHESQEAVFLRDGQALDTFGSGRHTLETQQLPLFSKIYSLPTDGASVFHAEVYFVNLTTQMGIKWGTPERVTLFDPASGLSLELGACGECSIRVIHSRRLLLKLVGTTRGIRQEELFGNGENKSFFGAMVVAQVRTYLARVIKEKALNVLELDENLLELSESMRERINAKLEEYGVEMPEFIIRRVILPENDPAFRQWRQQYGKANLLVREEQIGRQAAEAAAERRFVEMQTEARLKILAAQGEAEALRIRKEAETAAYRLRAEAEADEMKLKGYTFQQETARQVGLEAMKNGIGGAGGGSGLLGDITGLGIGLGMLGGVADLTKQAVDPVGKAWLTQSLTPAQPEASRPAEGWQCECGSAGNLGAFCPQCGKKKPEPPAPRGWRCECGAEGNTGRFCPNCGAERPLPALWDCPVCGEKQVKGKFCPECGTKREE